MNQTIHYTVLDLETKAENRLVFQYDDIGGYGGVPAKPVAIVVAGKEIVIEPQQLAELGALFLALAGVEGVDFSGADALLEGFEMRGKEAAEKLAAALEE